MVFAGIRQILVLPLSRLKKTRIISAVTLSAGFLNFGLNIAMIPWLGTIGAAISTTLTQILASVWLYYQVRKHDSIRYEIIKIGKILILGLSFYLISALIQDQTLFWRILIKSVLLLAFFFLLYLWNFYEKIEITRLKGAWKKWANLKNFWHNIEGIKFE